MVEDEHVLAVPTRELFARGGLQGLEAGGAAFLEYIFEPRHTQYIRRAQAENDPSWKQIIPYVILHCAGEVMVYTRGKQSGEKRLVAQQSIGLGGHIRHDDESFFAAPGLPAYLAAVRRELDEEVAIAAGLLQSERIVGVINDDSVDVGKVHFGVVHIWELARPEVARREAKINAPHFSPVDRLAAEFERFETWSQLCIRHWSELSRQPGWSREMNVAARKPDAKERAG